MPSPRPEAKARLDRLIGYLKHDPENLALLSEAAEAALEAHNPALTAELLNTYGALAPLPPREVNLSGLAALAERRFEDAAPAFTILLADAPGDPALRYNLAWARSHLGDFDEALDLLDETTTTALGQAATLEVHLLHELGRFDEGMARAKHHLERHPDHIKLAAAAAVLAVDAEDHAFAALCAAKAGDHPDALAALGSLALDDDRHSDALDLFERALAQNEASPRALVGRGLARLGSGNHGAAALDLERGAELFDDHIGSWIAAGWAHVVAGAAGQGRACFERALAIDPAFAETQGSLAVVSFLDGDAEAARRFAETALRLDRNSFAGALASALLVESDGKTDVARAIIRRALSTKIDARGRTIAQSLAKRGLWQ